MPLILKKASPWRTPLAEMAHRTPLKQVSAVLAVGTLIALVAWASAQDDTPNGERLYRVAENCTVKDTLEEVTTVRTIYALRPKGGKIELTIEELDSLIKKDGEIDWGSTITRKKYVELQKGGKSKEVTREQLSANQQRMQDSFGEMLCTLTLDKEGREVDREVTTNIFAGFLVRNILNQARFFHVPFPAEKDTWIASRVIALPESPVAAGRLHYRKKGTVAGMPHLIAVEVSGDIETSVLGGGKVKHKVRGEQTFNTKIANWESGKLNVVCTFTAGDKRKTREAYFQLERLK